MLVHFGSIQIINATLRKFLFILLEIESNFKLMTNDDFKHYKHQDYLLMPLMRSYLLLASFYP